MANSKAHWERIYTREGAENVGWYEPHLGVSLELIAGTGLGLEARIIDVGGGASTMVDDLLGQGFNNVTVLDLAPAGLALARARLGTPAKMVQWIEGDVKEAPLPKNYYDLWHDRAVFHFLTRQDDRERYVEAMRRALKPGAHIIIGTFSLEAPPRCSGLDVVRYGPDQLHRQLGNDLTLKESRLELHVTPGGVKQQYLYCRFRLPE